MFTTVKNIVGELRVWSKCFQYTFDFSSSAVEPFSSCREKCSNFEEFKARRQTEHILTLAFCKVQDTEPTQLQLTESGTFKRNNWSAPQTNEVQCPANFPGTNGVMMKSGNHEQEHTHHILETNYSSQCSKIQDTSNFLYLCVLLQRHDSLSQQSGKPV